MTLRQRLGRTLAATLIFVAATVAVGLTAPADGPFSIGIRPVFFGLDVDIKVGTLRFHFGWSAIPVAEQRSTQRSLNAQRRPFSADSADSAFNVVTGGIVAARLASLSTKPAASLL